MSRIGEQDLRPDTKAWRASTSLIWTLVTMIAVRSQQVYQQTMNALADAEHRPRVQIKRGWYY